MVSYRPFSYIKKIVTGNSSDRVRAARCAFSHIKLEKRALFSGQMREFRIYYF